MFESFTETAFVTFHAHSQIHNDRRVPKFYPCRRSWRSWNNQCRLAASLSFCLGELPILIPASSRAGHATNLNRDLNISQLGLQHPVAGIPPCPPSNITTPTMNAAFPMPPSTADLATQWAFLEEGVDYIMANIQKMGISYPHVSNRIVYRRYPRSSSM